MRIYFIAGLLGIASACDDGEGDGPPDVNPCIVLSIENVEDFDDESDSILLTRLRAALDDCAVSEGPTDDIVCQPSATSAEDCRDGPLRVARTVLEELRPSSRAACRSDCEG